MSKIAWYITGHGFGHAVRSVAIANCLPPEMQIIFRTEMPLSFFKEEMKRAYRLAPARFDCGCLQSDGVSVAVKPTLELYREIAETNRTRLEQELQWCDENEITGIVSDITPFAFDVARGAGIPSVAVTNFTWYDIYSEYLAEFPSYQPVVDEILEQYRKADLALALSPSLPMDYFPVLRQMSLVGRSGFPRRDALDKYFNASGKHLALIYVGEFGMAQMDWKRLEQFSDWCFLGIHPLRGTPHNYHRIDKSQIGYQDLVASVDCVIAKLGYGVVSECMINGTPIVYLPRNRFAEYPVLADAVEKRGMSVKLSPEEFMDMKWDEALERCIKMTVPRKCCSNGTMECGAALESFFWSV